MEKIPTFLLVVAAVLQRADGRLLMHQRPVNKHHGGLWEFPGGKVEPSENTKEALARELEEELAIEVDCAALTPAGFAVEQCDGDEGHIVILLYKTHEWGGEPRAVEGEAIGWFALEEISELSKPPLDCELADQLFLKEVG